MIDNNLCNTSSICKGNYGLNRKKMPQFNKKTLKKFINSLEKKNIKSKKGSFHVKNLKATQNEIFHPAIKNIQKKIRKCKFKPDTIVISKNNHVIDGHHRWASIKHCYNNPKLCRSKKCKKFNPYLKGYKINLEPLDIIKRANNFNGIYNINLNVIQ